MTTFLKEWIRLFKVLLGEIVLLVDISPSFENLNGPVHHFNSPFYFASREMAPDFLLSFFSHPMLRRTKTPET